MWRRVIEQREATDKGPKVLTYLLPRTRGRPNDRAVEQRDATDKGREVCPLRLPLMGAVVEGGLCS